MNRTILPAAIFGVLMVLGGMLFPEVIIRSLNVTTALVLQLFSNYYLGFGFLVVMISLVLIVLPFSRKRLGTQQAEYSRFSWIALLYSTGMGSGLLLRAVQEPVYYYTHPPVNNIPPEQLALQYTFFHWGFTPWALYSLFGLMVAWQLYIRKENNIAQAVLLGNKNKTFAQVTYVFITLITLTGVIASLGLGAGQFAGGIKTFFQWDLGNTGLLATVLCIGVVATLSALTGIQKLIKYLANFDMAASIALMCFVGLFLTGITFAGPTMSAFGDYLLHFTEMSLSLGTYRTSKAFTNDWTVFYWAFWIAWVPFTGIFIARISRGRTIREFLVVTIIVPALATMLWFSIFANKAISQIHEAGNYTGEYDDIFTSIYHFLYQLPFSSITVTLTALLVLISIINSVDSAIFVLAMFSDKGNINPRQHHKLSWGLIITAAALGLTALGSDTLLNAVSNLLIIMSLPFSFFYGWQILYFLFRIAGRKRKG
ncbi:MAG: BCCT transporter [Sphingobacteriales bacterium]|nr:MAG: BCCT transporter [Sphingobacteriales bacterium]